jgi:uncharacterized low-complexity protein
MSFRRALVPSALTLAVVLAVTGTANAAPHLQSARFKATLSGTQSTAWTLNDTTSCGTETGSGSKRVHFHQQGQLTLIFSRQLGGTRLLEVKVAGTGSNSVPIAGTMTQYGVLNASPNGKCGTGRTEGTPVAPPQPDCGTKSFTGTIYANWSPPDLYPEIPGEPAPVLPQFWIDEPVTQTDFRVCPFFGPLILFRLVHKGLSENSVFGPKPRLKLVREVSETEQYPVAGAPGVRSETTVDLTVQLTRLGGRH